MAADLGEAIMGNHIFALLVHDRMEPFADLKQALKELSVETYSVGTCKEAVELMTQCRPHVIFADAALADGSWLSLANMAEQADAPVSIIVVGKVPNTKLYLSVMERGAFDFVAPPFEHEPLHFIINSAALNTHHRREAAALAAAAC
jgi:DNA-binding NtrC family response regulator